MFLLPAAAVLAVPRQLQPGPDVAVPRQLQPGQDAFVSGAQLVCPGIKIKFYETREGANAAVFGTCLYERFAAFIRDFRGSLSAW